MHALTNTLSYILPVLFALGVIIFVHEAGHLLVAKAFKVRVLTFSLGFGKRLWGMERGGTEYRVSLLPLGGYVRLGGENVEEATGAEGEFLSKPRWQRILVYLAGPVMNVVLAIAIFAALFMVGIEVPNLPAIPSLIGDVVADSSAATAGLQRGDRIVEVQGEPVSRWQDVAFTLLTSPGKPVALTVERGDRTFTAQVVPKKDPKYLVGDWAGIVPSVRPHVTRVTAGFPAAAAGFRPGDEIRAVNGRPIVDGQDFVKQIEGRAGQKLDIEVARDGRALVLSVTPRLDGKTGRIGVVTGFYQRYGPARAVVESVRYNAQIVGETFRVIGKIFSRKIPAKLALSGPIDIAVQSRDAAQEGFKYLLHLMGFISISIAVLNLLPIPIMDGGQISILLIEGVIRRDLSIRLKEVISQVGFVMILLLMAMVIWFDATKHFHL